MKSIIKQAEQTHVIKIIPTIFGGLGNQLFCFAAARRLALVSGAELVIDDITGFARDFAYARKFQLHAFAIPCRKATAAERMEPASRIRRILARRINRCLPFERRYFIEQAGMAFDQRLLDIKPTRTIHLEGYWQSEQYFADVSSTIRSDLQMAAPNDDGNLMFAEKIRASLAVAIHVRYFDGPGVRSDLNTPQQYYVRALEYMEHIAPTAHYFVFSDRPEAACEWIGLPKERFTPVSLNAGDSGACADLWLMRQCRHFIIANSTFSWWGAWLGTGEDKKVIAPGMEIKEGKMLWGFDGLLPANWIKL